MKDFLIIHPTETVILEFTAENQDEGKFHYVFERLNKILRNLAKQKNPATGDYFVYMENGSLGRYTDYPKLRDCRGKIVIKCDELDLGIVDYSMGGKYRTYSPEGNYKDGPDTKVRHVTEFYDEYSGVPLLTDAVNSYDIFYKVGTNSAPVGLMGIPTATPLEEVDKIHPKLFKDGGVFDKHGEYLGWIVNDGAVPKVNRYIWESNFFNGLRYCDITVRSGLVNTELYPDQSFQLLLNTTITIPQNIYDLDQQTLGRYFAGWRDSNGMLLTPGQDYTVTGDVTFTAEWSSGVNTPIQIVWKDGGDKDGLRPESLTLRVNGNIDFSLSVSNNWIGIYNGSINDIVPVWDKINTSQSQQGQDTAGGYRYTMIGGEVAGYIITLIHTPQESVAVSCTVDWDDENNAEGIRPASVTLHLLRNGVEEISPQTASAANGWRCDFGTLPVYADGEKIEYTVTEDTIVGYDQSIIGFNVTNSHIIETVWFPVGTTWLDNDNAGNTRPGSVTVNLLMNGASVQQQVISPNEYGAWIYEFDVTALSGNDPDAKFSAAAYDIAGYTCEIDTSEGFYNIIFMSAAPPPSRRSLSFWADRSASTSI